MPQINEVNTTGWSVGTELFVVPIRYWDNDDIGSARVAEYVVDGEVIPDGLDENYVYALDDTCGHNAYLFRDSVFTSLEEAISYRDVLRAHYAMEQSFALSEMMKIVNELL